MGCGGPRRSPWSRSWTWSQVASHAAALYVIGCFAALVQPAWRQAGRTGDLLLLALFWTVFAASLGLYLFVCLADTRYREGSLAPSLGGYESRSCGECADNITRLRVKHCLTCGRCTEDFDHHCHYLNVCIGGRTYAAWYFFVAGLLALMASCAYAAADALAAPESYPLASRSRAAFDVLLGAEVALSLVLAAFLLCLLAQHTYFIYEGITTLEYIKDQGPGFPSLPPKGWREAVRQSECYSCGDVLEFMEVDDSSEVWYCTVCQADVGKAGLEFYSCESCENVNVCPLCYRAASHPDTPIVTYRVASLRRRAEAQARAASGAQGQPTPTRPLSSRASSHASQREGRGGRRSITAIVAAVEGHSGDAPTRMALCCPRGPQEAEHEDGDEESGSSSDGSAP